MYGMLANSGHPRSHVVGGNTEQTAILTRVLWGEIAGRWIPEGVLVPAAAKFFAEDGDDDA